MTKLLLSAIDIVRTHWRTYLWLNVFFYSVFLLGAVVVAQDPLLGTALQHNVGRSVRTGWLAPVYQAYAVSRDVPLAAALTFGINFVIGAGGMLTLPSFVLPFAGLLVLLHRFFLWGMILGPLLGRHEVLGTFLLEGQGYLMAALAIWIHGSWMVRPHRFGFGSVKQAFLAGVRMTGRVYVLVAVILIVAAVFESTAGIAASRPVFLRHAGEPSLAQPGDTSVTRAGSEVYFDPATTPEPDARIVSVLLRDIGYFTPSDTTEARLAKASNGLEISVLLPAQEWEHEVVQARFATLLAELDRSFPRRQHRIVAISVDSSGSRSTRVYE